MDGGSVGRSCSQEPAKDNKRRVCSAEWIKRNKQLNFLYYIEGKIYSVILKWWINELKGKFERFVNDSNVKKKSPFNIVTRL